MPRKIVHVVAGVEATNGAAVIACALARRQARAGDAVVVATTSSAGPRCDTTGCRLVVYPRTRWPFLRAACFSAAMLRSLGRLCADADEVFVHCQWTFPVWWGAKCARGRLVVVPEGSFDPVRLAHGRWKKRLVGFFDRCVLRKAASVWVTSEREADWVCAYEPRVNGVMRFWPPIEVPAGFTPLARTAGMPLRLLYLGRRHPLKGLDLLEEAVKGLSVELRVESSIVGQAKEAAFAWCNVLVLPTRSENFGLVVTEALARARPVIVTEGAPWADVKERGCGWWTAVDAGALREAIIQAVAKPEGDLRTMGMRGREWMLSKAAE